MQSSPVLVILAAGASSRLGEPKALVELGGSSPMERLFAAGIASFPTEPLLIAGPDFEAIRDAAPEDLEVLEHASWSDGRTGSIRAARRARPGRDLLIAPVDVPLVPREVFELMGRAWKENGTPPLGWLAPGVRRARGLLPGHPVLLGRELAARLEKVEPDTPLRKLRDKASPLWCVECTAESILDDLDTPLDLKSLRDSLAPPT